ncbi:hypothetical protein NE236_36810 [Actinoallomurus purpureus]|uniref:hypothetical protein n=1 Tax=Actinoallomurus purpureus TaxID=478114 RepID=UPI0020922CDB|nr:hypothetical protein [Actinoallomurus purpureus]MCO6010534.1 hypothetical protein [Actinoallomurus purpureus]
MPSWKNHLEELREAATVEAQAPGTSPKQKQVLKDLVEELDEEIPTADGGSGS